MSVQNSHQISDIKVLLKIGANGNGIVSVEKTRTVGNVDTYTITFSDGTTTNFDLTNGTSIDTIEKTDTQGLVDTYTITLTDGSTTTFEVVNGGVEFGTLETETGNPLSFETDSAQVANSTVITFEPIQAGSGDPSPSNVRAISGYKEFDIVSQSPDNLILYTIPNASIDSSGVITALNDWTVYVAPVSKGSTYTLRANQLVVGFYTERPEIGSVSYNNSRIDEGSLRPLVAPISGYMAFRVVSNWGYAPMVVLGDTAITDYYSPNIATDITIKLDKTIYGGTWDVEKGLLTITHVYKSFNGSEGWAWYSSSNSALLNSVLDGRKGEGSTYKLYGFCNMKPTDEDGFINDSIKATAVNGNNLQITQIGTNFGVTDVSLSGWKTWLGSHNLQIVYELATPIVLHITPHAVELLEDANVVTSNGTSIDLVYKTGVGATLADLKPLADCINAVEEAQSDKSDIADLYLTGTTNTTGATILAGTYFYLDGLFCKALLDIASDATFTKGTNYKVTTIGAELTALANS